MCKFGVGEKGLSCICFKTSMLDGVSTRMQTEEGRGRGLNLGCCPFRGQERHNKRRQWDLVASWSCYVIGAVLREDPGGLRLACHSLLKAVVSVEAADHFL
jgi:hypothetical protein